MNTTTSGVITNFDKLRMLDHSIKEVGVRQEVIHTEQPAPTGDHHSRTISTVEELQTCLQIVLARLKVDEQIMQEQFVACAALESLLAHYQRDEMLRDVVIKIDHLGEYRNSRQYSITVRSLKLNSILAMTHVLL